MQVPIEICREGIEIPKYANPSDSGIDIVAAEDITIHPGETKIIPTGIKVAIPEGYELQVRPRSGLSAKSRLRVANSPGTIDVGFRSEIGVIMTNISEKDTMPNDWFPTANITEVKNNENCIYFIPKGTRIAQIVLQPVIRIDFIKVDSVKDYGVDRGGGFGSTGL